MTYQTQLAKGRKVEREHLAFFREMKKSSKQSGKCPTDKQFTEGIAKAHIKEFPKGDYYKELAIMENNLKCMKKR